VTVLPKSNRPFRGRNIPRSTAGASLIELMVVVTIISMLMTMAVPTYQRVQRKARASALANDFRVFAAVFQSYAHENGAWPDEAAPGVIPNGITSDEIQTDTWSNPTVPIGGHFDWENNQLHNGVRYRAAIAITDTADAPLLIDLEMFQEIDQDLDDGNLTTGSFILGDNDCPLYILEP
jgi:type II secretory pathway pseudopilin PulG